MYFARRSRCFTLRPVRRLHKVLRQRKTQVLAALLDLHEASSRPAPGQARGERSRLLEAPAFPAISSDSLQIGRAAGTVPGIPVRRLHAARMRDRQACQLRPSAERRGAHHVWDLQHPDLIDGQRPHRAGQRSRQCRAELGERERDWRIETFAARPYQRPVEQLAEGNDLRSAEFVDRARLCLAGTGYRNRLCHIAHVDRLEPAAAPADQGQERRQRVAIPANLLKS